MNDDQAAVDGATKPHAAARTRSGLEPPTTRGHRDRAVAVHRAPLLAAQNLAQHAGRGRTAMGVDG